jgi:Arc/MetJ-type ribon-helix-helix transcriptional regulator
MKLSVSVPEEQIERLDRIVEARGLASRSAAIQEGIELLIHDSLVAEYKSAFREWTDAGEGTTWESTVNDGLEPETPWW